MQKIIVYWRDIPAQVIVKHRRDRGTVELSQRFQEAIDRAAMRAGKGSSDDYLEDWRRDTTAARGEGSLQGLAQQEADLIESHYSEEALSQLVANLGYQSQ